MRYMRSDLERTIQRRMDDVLSRVDYKTQNLQKDLTEVIKKSQVELETVELSFDRWMRKLQKGLTTQVQSRHRLQRSADGDAGNQEGTPRKYLSIQTRIPVSAEHERRTRNGTSAVKQPKFDGASSGASSRP
jgi:hypothetical protein